MRKQKLSGLLLCGGGSTRFGSPKALAMVGGQPLVTYPYAVLREISEEIIISANDPTLFNHLTARIVTDHFPGAGPLAGLHAGLKAASHELVAVLACDVPLASASLLRFLADMAEGFDAVVPVWRKQTHAEAEKVIEPLHAVYRRTMAQAAAEVLAAGGRRVADALRQVRVNEVGMETWAAATGLGPEVFRNVNEPSDVPEVEELLGSTASTLDRRLNSTPLT